MVFYRKYRPQKIEDLDSENVRESLSLIFSKKNYPHAFLFTGPKGLGKTSAARIVAKVIDCINRKSVEPCNKCEQCVSITNGTNLDVLEIDGASNRGIDEIRDLREKIKLAPFKASKKVYIIDEVHMLTTEAFNALLKVLEEPPGHAVFILCTTEPHKVPATIISRCFRVNFARASETELIRSMSRIVKNEGIKIEKEALFEIARLSDGSFRDGAKILEEVSLFAGRKNITTDLVREKYNTLGISESISKIMDAFLEKDVKKGLTVCKELAKQGMDFKFFIEEVIERLHLMLLMEAGVETPDTSVRPGLVDIKRLFELLTDAYQQTKVAVLPEIPLELAVIEWAGEGDSGALGSAEDRGPVPGFPPASAPHSQGSEMRAVGSPSTRATPHQPSPLATQSNSLLNDLIEEVKKHNPLVAGLLRGCSMEEVKNGKINIVTKSEFHKKRLEETKTMKILEQSVKDVLDKEAKVYIILKGVI